MKIYYESYLTHHGIKGQKWGVRRFQNPDGTLTSQGKLRYSGSGFGSGSKSGGGHPKQFKSARALRKYIRRDDVHLTNMKNVGKDYQKELKNNKEYNELGRKSINLAKKSVAVDKKYEKIEDETGKDRDWVSYNKENEPFVKERNECVKKLHKIEYDTAQKYTRSLNEAKLKDLGWDGDTDKGIKLLEKYDEAAYVRWDGVIFDTSNYIMRRHFMIIPDNDYTEAWDNAYEHYS